MTAALHHCHPPNNHSLGGQKVAQSLYTGDKRKGSPQDLANSRWIDGLCGIIPRAPNPWERWKGSFLGALGSDP